MSTVLGVLGIGVSSAFAAPVGVGVNQDAEGDYVAVSHGGNAHAPAGLAVSTTGCAAAEYAWVGAVSGTGCADGGHLGVSGTGPVGQSSETGSYGTTFYGVSGTGCVRAFYVAVSGGGCAEGDVAVSGAGDAHGDRNFDVVPYAGQVPDGPGIAVSGTGNADGGAVAVAPAGSATAGTYEVWGPTGRLAGTGLAVAGAGRNASGGEVAIAGGHASGDTVAVGGGNAYASGGLVTVSATGDGGGGSIINVCPMGRCA